MNSAMNASYLPNKSGSNTLPQPRVTLLKSSPKGFFETQRFNASTTVGNYTTTLVSQDIDFLVEIPAGIKKDDFFWKLNPKIYLERLVKSVKKRDTQYGRKGKWAWVHPQDYIKGGNIIGHRFDGGSPRIVGGQQLSFDRRTVWNLTNTNEYYQQGQNLITINPASWIKLSSTGGNLTTDKFPITVSDLFARNGNSNLHQYYRFRVICDNPDYQVGDTQQPKTLKSSPSEELIISYLLQDAQDGGGIVEKYAIGWTTRIGNKQN